MPLDAGSLSWALACHKIEKKLKISLQPPPLSCLNYKKNLNKYIVRIYLHLKTTSGNKQVKSIILPSPCGTLLEEGSSLVV